MSNRPAPGVNLGGASGTAARQTAGSATSARSFTSQASVSGQSATAQMSAVRDELVRAVMPELQVLMRHLVDTAVERAIAPLADKQRELELAIKELRAAQVSPAPMPVTSTKQTAELAMPMRTAQAQSATVVQPSPSQANTVQQVVVTRKAQPVAAIAYDTDNLADIPSELNGSRRKKIILSTLAVAVVLALLAAVVLSILSNRGMYL